MIAEKEPMNREDAARLEAATTLLRGFQPVSTQCAREDVWARLDRRSRRADWVRGGWSFAVAASVVFALAGLWTWSRSGPEVPRPGRGLVLVESNGIVLEDGTRVAAGSILTTRERAEIRSTRVRVLTTANTSLRLIDVPDEQPLVELRSGEVEIELTPSEMTTVVTPTVRVRLLGARVRLEVNDERVALTALSSTLRVEINGKQQALESNQSLVLKTPERERIVAPRVKEPAEVVPSRPLAPPASTMGSRLPTQPPPLAAPEPSVEAQLDRAHEMITRDATGAENLARVVLERAPTPKVEARALAILADARRRNGAKAEATALYRQVAEHDSGAPYAEESLYQAARLLFEMKRSSEALTVLAEAHLRFPSGPLAPERHALAADVHEANGARGKARAALVDAKRLAESAGDGASASRFSARLEKMDEKE